MPQFLSDVDVSQNRLLAARAETLANDPTASIGRFYLNSGSKKLRIYDGIAWSDVGGAASAGLQYAPGGTADDTVALQAYIDALPANSECHFAPGRVYTVSAPIQFRADLVYIGHGHSHGETASTIKQKAGANITSGSTNPISGLFVPKEWWSNATTCAYPTRFCNLKFDANAAENPTTTACGLVTMNFWLWVSNCVFKGSMDKGYGLYLADKTRNNVSITNSCSEPHIYENRFEDCKGFYAQCSNGQANLDGVLFDNKFVGIFGTAIEVERAAGWSIETSHIYGGSSFGSAILAYNCFATTIMNNYIEDFGAQGTSGVWYMGISATILDQWGTRIIGNHVASPEVAGSYQEYITVIGGWGQTAANVVVADNTLYGGGGANATGIMITNSTGGVLRAVASGNSIYGFSAGKNLYVSSENVLTWSGKRRVNALVVASNTYEPNCGTDDVATISNPSAAFTVANPKGVAQNGQMILIKITSTAIRTITWGINYISSGIATLPTATVANKTIQVLVMYDSNISKWVCVTADSTGY